MINTKTEVPLYPYDFSLNRRGLAGDKESTASSLITSLGGFALPFVVLAGLYWYANEGEKAHQRARERKRKLDFDFHDAK